MMKVPLLDLAAQYATMRREIRDAMDRVCESQHFILGPEVDALEKEIAAYCSAGFAIGVSSGTDALLAALMAAGVGPGDEVITSTYSFFATAGVIARLQARPVFVDIDAATFNLDAKQVDAALSARTKAIIPVHLFGQSANMDAVMDLARKHNLAVIEDGAQSLGAKCGGRFVGGIGTFGTYSFFPSKNLGALGDAGMLVANDDALAEKARLLRTHGSKPKYYHKLVGANFRLDSIQAAFLRVKLPHYNSYTEKRTANAAFYTEKLSKLPGVILASDSQSAPDAKMILPVAQPNCDHIWNQYTLRLPGAGRRDALKKHLTDRGIGTEIYYPVPMHEQECFAYCNAMNSCPAASRLAQEVISIPIYPELAPAQRDEVVAELAVFLK